MKLNELEQSINRNMDYKLCSMTRREAMALIACVRAADAMLAAGPRNGTGDWLDAAAAAYTAARSQLDKGGA